MTHPAPEPRPVRLKAPLVGVVCTGCARRAGGKWRKAARQLARAIRDRIGRKVQVAAHDCLKLCPRHHVLVVPADGVPRLVGATDWLDQAACLMAATTTGRP